MAQWLTSIKFINFLNLILPKLPVIPVVEFLCVPVTGIWRTHGIWAILLQCFLGSNILNLNQSTVLHAILFHMHSLERSILYNYHIWICRCNRHNSLQIMHPLLHFYYIAGCRDSIKLFDKAHVC